MVNAKLTTADQSQLDNGLQCFREIRTGQESLEALIGVPLVCWANVLPKPIT
jgi:hypothetical protein